MNKKYQTIFAFIFIILCFSSLITYPTIPTKVSKPDDTSIRVMNFNIHFGVEVNKGYNLDPFVDLISKYEPNLIGFEEITFHSPINGFANMFGELKSKLSDLGYKFSYFQKGGDYYLRNAIFSQFEILETNTIDYPAQNIYQRSLVTTKINVNGKNLQYFVTHLTHIGDNGNSVRLKQIDTIVSEINDRNFMPIILSGDFNIEPNTTGISKITDVLVDGYNFTFPEESGFTFPSHNPTKRIDYIFLSENIDLDSCNLINTTISDHLPIYCDITI